MKLRDWFIINFCKIELCSYCHKPWIKFLEASPRCPKCDKVSKEFHKQQNIVFYTKNKMEV